MRGGVVLRLALSLQLLESLLAAPAPEKSSLFVVKCRTHCQRTLTEDGLRASCLRGEECLRCWASCQAFQSGHYLRDYCKHNKACTTGCRRACQFYASSSPPTPSSSSAPAPSPRQPTPSSSQSTLASSLSEPTSAPSEKTWSPPVAAAASQKTSPAGAASTWRPPATGGRQRGRQRSGAAQVGSAAGPMMTALHSAPVPSSRGGAGAPAPSSAPTPSASRGRSDASTPSSRGKVGAPTPSTSWSEDVAQLQPKQAGWRVRVAAMEPAGPLVAVRLRWRPRGPHRQYLVTWELRSGGLKGHLVSDDHHVTLSLWPDEQYVLKIYCGAEASAPLLIFTPGRGVGGGRRLPEAALPSAAASVEPRSWAGSSSSAAAALAAVSALLLLLLLQLPRLCRRQLPGQQLVCKGSSSDAGHVLVEKDPPSLCGAGHVLVEKDLVPVSVTSSDCRRY